jgi:hypothetical protein
VFGASPDKFCVVALLFHKKEYGAVPFVIDKVIDPLLPPDAFTTVPFIVGGKVVLTMV